LRKASCLFSCARGLTSENGVLLLINMVFDYLLLWTTSFLIHRRVETLRLLIISFFGGLYAVCVFFLPDFVYNLPCKLLVGGGMTLAAFRPNSVKKSLQYVLVFFTVVFVLGGMGFCLLNYTGFGSVFGAVYHNGSLYINLPVYLLLLLIVVCYMMLKTVFAIGARIAVNGKQIMLLRIDLNGKSVQLKGFYDSGNLLRDHQNRGVIVAEWQSMKSLFGNADSPEETEMEWLSLEFTSLNGKGKLLAFTPDAIYIDKGRRLQQMETLCVAVTAETLDFYNNWDAILPHDFEGVDERNEAIIVQKVNGCCQSSGQTNI